MVTVLAHEFEVQRQQILLNFDPSKISKSYRKKDYLNDLVDWPNATDSMRKAVQPIIFSLISETGQDAISAVGLDSSQFNPVTTAIMNYYQSRATKIAQDINDETEKQLRAALSKGIADGVSTHELRAVVEDVMGNASTMRADRIARTETSRAQNFGDIEAWTQSGVVEGKEFLTAEDESVCPFCSDLDGKTAGLNENFFNKGDSLTATNDKTGNEQTLEFNYDDIPSPPLHVSCRCSILPIRS